MRKSNMSDSQPTPDADEPPEASGAAENAAPDASDTNYESESAASGYKYTNRLAYETSPYLLQHAHNPVDWYPWGEEAFARAREEDKPILLSIGYSACH